MNEHYDIFISYRRDGGYDTAKHLNDLLVRDGYIVSFDIDTLRSGDFDTQLLERIDQCKDFILIVDQHCFDRTLDPRFDPKKDWLRCELAYALKKQKNIIPIFLSGVNGFPDNLPSDVEGVIMKNGPEYNRYHFNAFYEDLKKRFLKSKHNHSLWEHVIIVIILICVLISVKAIIDYCNQRDNNLQPIIYVPDNEPLDNPKDIDTIVQQDYKNVMIGPNSNKSKNNQGNELLYVIQQFVKANEANSNAYWDIYSNNRGLSPLSKHRESSEIEKYPYKLTYKGILYYNNKPLSTNIIGEPGEWNVSLYGPNSSPMLLSISSDYNPEDYHCCSSDAIDYAQEVAGKLNFKLVRKRSYYSTTSLLYINQDSLYYHILSDGGSLGASLDLIIAIDKEEVEKYEISEELFQEWLSALKE